MRVMIYKVKNPFMLLDL